ELPELPHSASTVPCATASPTVTRNDSARRCAMQANAPSGMHGASEADEALGRFRRDCGAPVAHPGAAPPCIHRHEVDRVAFAEHVDAMARYAAGRAVLR